MRAATGGRNTQPGSSFQAPRIAKATDTNGQPVTSLQAASGARFGDIGEQPGPGPQVHNTADTQESSKQPGSRRQAFTRAEAEGIDEHPGSSSAPPVQPAWLPSNQRPVALPPHLPNPFEALAKLPFTQQQQQQSSSNTERNSTIPAQPDSDMPPLEQTTSTWQPDQARKLPQQGSDSNLQQFAVSSAAAVSQPGVKASDVPQQSAGSSVSQLCFHSMFCFRPTIANRFHAAAPVQTTWPLMCADCQ